MTHDQLADITIGACVVIPMLLVLAVWLLWPSRKERERRREAASLRAMVESWR
jgi:hypothetical protein